MARRLKQTLRTGTMLAFVAAAMLAASASATAAAGAHGVAWRPVPAIGTAALRRDRGTDAAANWMGGFLRRIPARMRHQAVGAARRRALTQSLGRHGKVNSWANQAIKPITDMEHWGVIERWNYPDDGYGDCEDYVLLKRRMLMQAGWPREALLITVVRDKKGDGHAVLTVKTDRGEFVLDNQEPQVLSWERTGYRFVKRQSQSDPNAWVLLGEPPAAPAIVSAR